MVKEERKITAIPAEEAKIQPAKLVFFCKRCQKIVSAKQTRKKFTFQCPSCNKTDVAYGTEVSIRNFYHIPEGSDTNDRAAAKSEKKGAKKLAETVKKPVAAKKVKVT